jgi:small membrane protein
MRQLLIQLLLIVGTLAVAWRLLVSYGQRAQALRRLGLVALAAFAVYSILDPSKTWTNLARLLGVGRGADLILYGLVLAFFGFVATTFRRFRDMEVRYTRLARRIALDEAAPPTLHATSPHMKPTGSPDTLSGDIPPSPSVKAADAD